MVTVERVSVKTSLLLLWKGNGEKRLRCAKLYKNSIENHNISYGVMNPNLTFLVLTVITMWRSVESRVLPDLHSYEVPFVK